jgi:hypothetical protein
MVQSGMRITVSAAMRARDVSRPQTEPVKDQPEKRVEGGPEPAKPRKGERRRMEKRAAAEATRRALEAKNEAKNYEAGNRPAQAPGSGGSSPVSS